MAWITNHLFEKDYISLSECNNDVSNGTVLRCETITPYSTYVYYDDGEYYYAYHYDTLDECIDEEGGQEYCAQVTFNTRGFYTDSNSYDLNIGQDGGVIANPNSAYLFSYYTNVESIDLTYFDTANVINRSYMFESCGQLKDLDISSFDTSNVTNMSRMFYGCKTLTSLDISSFDTSNVTTMEGMFYTMSNVVSLDLSNFDTANVTTMGTMFNDTNNCERLV